jgi:hypothetical protein
LLDAIRNVPNRFADAAMFGDVIKQLEMMNIHGLMKTITAAFLSINAGNARRVKEKARSETHYENSNS